MTTSAFSSATMSDLTAKDVFLSRVQSLIQFLNHCDDFDVGNMDNYITRVEILYSHAVRCSTNVKLE